MRLLASARIRAICATAIALAVTGCGGGGGSVKSVVPDSSHRSVRDVSSTPVLYVATAANVYAYNLTDTGTTAPQRTITRAGAGSTNVGITAYTDGTLDILQNTTSGLPCRILVESATANGAAPALAKVACSSDTVTGLSIATNAANGGIDVLYDDTTTSTYELARFSQSTDGAGTVGSPTTLTIPEPVIQVTTDGGHDFVDNTAGQVAKYAHTATGSTAENLDITLPSGTSGAMAVSPVDKTLYVVEPGAGASGEIRLAGYLPTTYASNGGAPAAPDYYYDFPGATSVPAITVDDSGNVYAAIQNANNSVVKVYPPHLTSKNTQALTITGGPITGLAIFQPPA